MILFLLVLSAKSEFSHFKRRVKRKKNFKFFLHIMKGHKGAHPSPPFMWLGGEKRAKLVNNFECLISLGSREGVFQWWMRMLLCSALHTYNLPAGSCHSHIAIPTLPFPFSAGQRSPRALPYPLQAKSVLFSDCISCLLLLLLLMGFSYNPLCPEAAELAGSQEQTGGNS